MIDWNFLIGIILLYIGLGVAYTQWEIDYYFKHGKARKPNLFTVLCYLTFCPIYKARIILGV